MQQRSQAHWRHYNPNLHHQEVYCAIYGRPGGRISNAIAPTIRGAPNNKNHYLHFKIKSSNPQEDRRHGTTINRKSVKNWIRECIVSALTLIFCDWELMVKDQICARLLWHRDFFMWKLRKKEGGSFSAFSPFEQRSQSGTDVYHMSKEEWYWGVRLDPLDMNPFKTQKSSDSS